MEVEGKQRVRCVEGLVMWPGVACLVVGESGAGRGSRRALGVVGRVPAVAFLAPSPCP